MLQRLTDATEERDEALAAAQREWRLAELLRQELAGVLQQQTTFYTLDWSGSFACLHHDDLPASV
jgi:hypothetical protein